MSEGMLLVVSAPSGCGKTTMLRRVMGELPNLAFSISHTTRSPRGQEQDGHHYYFVTPQRFLDMRNRKPSAFIEWAEVHGNYYGTSRNEVERLQQLGQDVLLDIDVQGAEQVMEKASPVSVFVAPPSMAELERRLRGRGTEDDDTIALRLRNATTEMKAASRYDYLIVNDVLDEAVASLKSIIIAERCRYRADRLHNVLNTVR